MERFGIGLTTNAGGTALGTITMVTPPPKTLYAVEWVDGTWSDGVDATIAIVNTTSGVNTTILTLTNANNDAWYYPRIAECDNGGTALTTYALPVITGDIAITVTSGGSVTAGSVFLYLADF